MTEKEPEWIYMDELTNFTEQQFRQILERLKCDMKYCNGGEIMTKTELKKKFSHSCC